MQIIGYAFEHLEIDVGPIGRLILISYLIVLNVSFYQMLLPRFFQ